MKNIVIVQPLKYTDIRQDKMIKSFVQEGYNVHVIFSKENESKSTQVMYSEIIRNITFYNLETKIPVNIPFNYYRYTKINRIIDKINPDILICRDIFMSGFIRKKHNYKSYLDICDNFPEVLECLINEPLNNIAKKIGNYYEKKAINAFKNIIFVSESSARFVLNKHRLEPKNYFILENVPNIKEIVSYNNEKYLDFVYIGTINKKIRDIDTVIDAIKFSKSKGFNFKFDIYYFKNQINVIDEYRSIVKINNLEDNIKFYEAVPLEELPKTLNKYKCGLVPHCRNNATDYTIPNKLYDYLQQGINVITSDNPSLVKFSDELEVTTCYSGGNYKSLSDAMIKLSGYSNEFENIKAIELIRTNLNWESCFEKFYRSMEENNENCSY